MPAKNPETTSSQLTSDHQTIQQWTEERGGVPATVKNTKNGDSAGLLRIKFSEHTQGKSEQNLEEISWEDFFKKFDESNLKFLYQEKTKDGKVSRFFKFVRGGGGG